jgi:hypothetical protein
MQQIIEIIVLLIWFWPTTLIVCGTIYVLVSTIRFLLMPIWTLLDWLSK